MAYWLRHRTVGGANHYALRVRVQGYCRLWHYGVATYSEDAYLLPAMLSIGLKYYVHLQLAI